MKLGNHAGRPQAPQDIAVTVNALALGASGRPPTYLPEDMSPVLAHTKMLGPGESDMVEVTAPAEAGTYPYLCTFPGHFAIMKGVLVVE